MEDRKHKEIQEYEEIYSLQKLMYEYSKTISTYSDPTFVRISQLLDKKINKIQRTSIEKCYE